MTPTVSIIVPVYNASAFLRKCVDSIVAQTYEGIEVLLIDDGSKDDSGAICDEYAAKDPRVRVIHKKNGGVSAARNTALDNATGDYIQFIDSDDWYTTDASSLLVKRAEATHSDLVVADFYRVVGDRTARKGDIDTDEPLTLEEYAEEMMENPADYYFGVLWNKLYRRDIIEEHKLRMDPNINFCEDFMFNLEYLRYCKVITALRTPIYYYLKRKGSLVSQGLNISKTVRMKTSVFEYYEQFYKNIFSEEEYQKNRARIYGFLIDYAGDEFVMPTILPNSYKLGEERIYVNTTENTEAGVFAELYRQRRLFEQKLEPIALQYHISLLEAEIIYCIWKTPELQSYKELQDVLGCSKAAVFTAMQHLFILGYVNVEYMLRSEDDESLKESKEHWSLMEAADPVLAGLGQAEEEYRKLME